MNRRDILKALAGIPLLGLLVKLSRVAKPIVVDAIKEIVDREDWSGTCTHFVLNNDFGYFEVQATMMGQAARQTLERYVLGVMGNDGLIHIGESP